MKALIAFLCCPLVAVAATEPSRLSLPVKKALEQKKFEETHELTDPELRARAGSLSRYSFTLNLSYDGPPLSDLSAEEQPNPDRGIGVYATSLGGSLGGRYRLTSDSSLTLTAGISALYPFHGLRRTDVNNPALTYDLTGRAGAYQLRQAIGASYTTVPNFRRVGQVGGLVYSFSTVRDLGEGAFSLGFNAILAYSIYERPYVRTDGRASRFFLGVGPNLKYNVTDRLNVYSGLRLNFSNPRSLENEWALQNRTWSQRAGIGYGFGRNAYVSPHLVFYPSHLAMDTTTVNLSTVFSGF